MAASQRAAINQREIFEHLVRTHQGAVRAFLRRLTREQALADDLAQDTFIRALSRMGQLKDKEAAKAWLFQIAYRVFLDSCRKSARQNALRLEKNGDGFVTKFTQEAKPGLAMDLARAMDNLAPDARACVILVLAQGLSHSEASGVTGLPIGTVKSHIKRGRAALQKTLIAYKDEVDLNHD